MPSLDGAAGKTVLIIEDEVLLRLALADDLRDRGFTAIEAANGDEARELIMAGVQVDAVFSDITMPGEMDGAGFAEWLHKNGFSTPVLLTSGLPSALDAARARLPHVAEFIPKPYGHDAVVERIANLLQTLNR